MVEHKMIESLSYAFVRAGPGSGRSMSEPAAFLNWVLLDAGARWPLAASH